MAMQSGFIKRIRDIMRMDAGINGDAQRIEQMVWMLFLKVYDAKEDDWELNEDNYESIIPEDLRWRNWAKVDSNGHAMTACKEKVKPQMGLAARKFGRRCGERSAAQISHHKVPA